MVMVTVSSITQVLFTVCFAVQPWTSCVLSQSTNHNSSSYHDDMSATTNTTESASRKRNETTVTMIKQYMKPVTMIRGNKTLATMIKNNMTPATMIRQDMTPVTMIRKSMTPATMIRQDMTPVTMIRQDMTPATMIRKSMTPATIIRQAMTSITTMRSSEIPTTVERDVTVSYHQNNPSTSDSTSTYLINDTKNNTESKEKDTELEIKTSINMNLEKESLVTRKTNEPAALPSLQVTTTDFLESKNSSNNTSVILKEEVLHSITNDSIISKSSSSTFRLDHHGLRLGITQINETLVDVQGHSKERESDKMEKCLNCTSHNIAKSRQKKHMHLFNTYAYRQRFYNYKLLYNTLRGHHETNHKETEFYAWIFGATMLTLGSLTTMASCFVFCICGDRWRQRRTLKYSNKDFSYERVDSVTSVVTII